MKILTYWLFSFSILNLTTCIEIEYAFLHLSSKFDAIMELILTFKLNLLNQYVNNLLWGWKLIIKWDDCKKTGRQLLFQGSSTQASNYSSHCCIFACAKYFKCNLNEMGVHSLSYNVLCLMNLNFSYKNR